MRTTIPSHRRISMSAVRVADVRSMPINPSQRYQAIVPSRLVPGTESGGPASPGDGRMVKRSSGRSLILYRRVRGHGLGFATDYFTTLIDSSWAVVLVVFSLAYVLSWLVFGGIIYAVVALGGVDNCVKNVHTFSAAILFSIEVETTIGFGDKYFLEDCYLGIILLVVQSVIGLILDAILLGLVFTKLTRPTNRRKTIVFSKVALIYEKDGERILEFRVGDIRRSQVVECHVRLQLYWNKLVDDESSHRYEFQQFDLDVGYDTGRDRIFLLTPVSVHHYITEESPLHGLTSSQLASSDLELVIILEGIVEATGLTAQALWSYTRDEILLDREFVPMITRSQGKWEVDFSKMDRTQPV